LTTEIIQLTSVSTDFGGWLDEVPATPWPSSPRAGDRLRSYIGYKNLPIEKTNEKS